MYGTNGPVGGALVVVGAVVVVPLVVVAADDVEGAVVAPVDVEGAVVVAPVDVDPDEVVGPVVVVSVVPVKAEEVVGAVVVSVVPEPLVPDDVDEVSLAAPVEVVSLEVELEKVLPIVIGETSPSAPETSKPSTKTAPIPTKTLI